MRNSIYHLSTTLTLSLRVLLETSGITVGAPKIELLADYARNQKQHSLRPKRRTFRAN
ncbi:MAG: hypothetical protein ACKVHP_20785 [Verrucomicrobiales bacterium]